MELVINYLRDIYWMIGISLGIQIARMVIFLIETAERTGKKDDSPRAK